MMQETRKMIETLEHGYSSEGTQRELINEYQHDRVKVIFKNSCVLVLWLKIASALEGLLQEPALGVVRDGQLVYTVD